MSRQQILQGGKSSDRRTKAFTNSAAFAATWYTAKPLRSISCRYLHVRTFADVVHNITRTAALGLAGTSAWVLLHEGSTLCRIAVCLGKWRLMAYSVEKPWNREALSKSERLTL